MRAYGEGLEAVATVEGGTGSAAHGGSSPLDREKGREGRENQECGEKRHGGRDEDEGG